MGHGTKERDLPIFVSLKGTKQGEEPLFHYKDNGEVTTGDYLSGYITDITLGEFEHRGKKIQTYIMHLVDGDNKYKFDIPFNSMSRAILNYLMTVEFPGKIQIQVVESKESDGYPSVFVSVDEGPALKWKWKYDHFSKLIDSDGDDKDYSRLNAMWIEQIKETLAPHFKEAFARMSHNGNFASSPKSEDKPEIIDGSVKAKDIDLSDQAPALTTEDLPIIEQENDDLPF